MAKDFKQRFISTVQSGLNSVSTAMLQQQHFGPTAFYPSTLDQVDPNKCGWLRKQGGMVRSWHRRWFVLKGDYLCYYTSEEECLNGRPPLGSIFLPGNHVSEAPFNPTENEKFLFEIVSGDGEKVSSTHETYLMSAETEEERKDWLRSIKEVLYQKDGGAIFGQPLEVTLQYERKRDSSRKIPEIVESCVEYLQRFGLHEEGLFRLPGRNALIRQLAGTFDRGERPSLTELNADIHSVASLLKSYLRDLPEPLIPFVAYEKVMHLISREKEEIGEEQAVVKLSQMLTYEMLSPSSYNVMQYLCRFLAEVASNSDVNKMNSLNLATVFVQCFIRPELDDPNLMLATSTQRTVATQILISHYDKIFTADLTDDGTAVVVGDLLGLNSVSCSVDASAKPTKREISYDLAGLDFTASQSSTEERAVLRRSARGDAMPSNGSKSNNRVGIVHDDQDFSDHSVKHSVSCQDKLLSGKSSESESEAKAGINGTEGQHVTSLSLDDGSQPMNGRKQSFGRKSCAPEAPPRNVTALLRSKSRNANDQTASVNNPPMLRPKPANIGRVVTNNQSSVTTGELSVDNQLPVTLVDWKLEAERLQTRLTVVEKERDDALARAKELERQLAILKNDMQARQQQGN